MKLHQILIENYRNLDEFKITLENFNLIIGENNIGKSNLLNAINLVLDPLKYVRNFNAGLKDFHDVTNSLVLVRRF